MKFVDCCLLAKQDNETYNFYNVSTQENNINEVKFHRN